MGERKLNRILVLCSASIIFGAMTFGCGDKPKKSDELDEPAPYQPAGFPGGDDSRRPANPYGNGDTGKGDLPPRNYDDTGTPNVDGDTVKPDPPPGGDPGDPTDPVPTPTPTPTPDPDPVPPDAPVETPPQFEGVWTFYQYCVIAEDRVEAMNYLPLFPNILFFEAWLKDIQTTVAAVRVRLPYAKDGRIPQENCMDAYNLFKEKIVFSLAPDPIKTERFDIVNIDPISGLPSLRALNLRDNKIVNMTFLRNLTALKFLDLSVNLIKKVPKLRRTMLKGLVNLEEFGIEYQGKEFSILDLVGVAQLFNVQSFKMIRLKGNTIDPSNLRYFPTDFKVSTTRVLQFLVGTESCDEIKWGFHYPAQLEEKRLVHCGSR